MFQSLSQLNRPRTALTIAGSLVGMALVSGASAAECVNGYRTLGNGVILACVDTVPAEAVASYESSPGFVAAPAPAPLVGGGKGTRIADGWRDCQPGRYRIINWEDDDMLMAC